MITCALSGQLNLSRAHAQAEGLVHAVEPDADEEEPAQERGPREPGVGPQEDVLALDPQRHELREDLQHACAHRGV